MTARLAVAAAVVAVVLLMFVVWWWGHPPAPADELRARWRPLATLTRAPAAVAGPGVERWRMAVSGADTVTALWKPGRMRDGAPAWSVVVLGGIGTDDRAALLIPDSLSIDVLAVSWPWKGPRRLGRLEFLTSVPKLREAMLRTPAAIALGVAAVRRERPGSRVALAGASLGVPPTVAALVLVQPDALVLVDGAADLERLLRSETSRVLGGGAMGRLLAPPAAGLGSRLVRSLEPSRHAAARGLPVLLIDAERDERYPPECVARLRAAFPAATRAMHPGGHVRPQDRRAMGSIIDQASRWLTSLPPPPDADRTSGMRSPPHGRTAIPDTAASDWDHPTETRAIASVVEGRLLLAR